MSDHQEHEGHHEHEGETHEAHHTAHNNKTKSDVTLRLNRRALIGIVLVVAALIFGYFARGMFVSAVVEGSPIMRLTVIHELEKASGKQVLEGLIIEKLVEKEAAKKNITVSQDEMNAEVAKIEDQLKAQGGTLDQVLAMQNIPQDVFLKQVRLQKTLEKLVEANVTVTEAEVTQYIKDNKVQIPAGSEAMYMKSIQENLVQQKKQTAMKSYLDDLRAKAAVINFSGY